MQLSGKAARYLRSLGHSLDPIVQIGKDGIKANVISAVNRALEDHELIKVKLLQEAPVDRHEAAEELSKQTESEMIQVLGRTVLLYKRHPKEPKIELPKKGKGTKSESEGESDD